MIVGQQKPFDEIWEMVKGFKKILVYGCNTCVAICHAGGGKEAEILASMLRMKAAQEGVDMQIDSQAIERHCEPEFFEPLMEKVRTYDLVLSTACGVGVNFLSDRIGNIPVYRGSIRPSSALCLRPDSLLNSAAAAATASSILPAASARLCAVPSRS